MNITRSMRILVPLTVGVFAVWLSANSPIHSSAAPHYSPVCCGAAGLLASLVLYALLFTRRSGAPMEKRYAATFRWIIAAIGLFVAAALMEQDASAPKWQNSILVLYYLSAIIGIAGTTPFLFGQFTKRR